MLKAPTLALTTLSAVAGLAQAQAGSLSIITWVGRDAPGISGPYTIEDLRGGSVADDGRVVLSMYLARVNGARQDGLYVYGAGRSLTNLIDTNADTVITETGTDGVQWLGEYRDRFVPGAPDAEPGVVEVFARLDTLYTPPGGPPTDRAVLRCAPGQTPTVIGRPQFWEVTPGGPVPFSLPNPSSEVRFSQDFGSAVIQERINGGNDRIWSVENGLVGDVFLEPGMPAATAAGAPAKWEDRSIVDVGFQFLTNTGTIMAGAVIEGTPVNDPPIYRSALLIGRPGEGYQPLYDPAQSELVFNDALSAEMGSTFVYPLQLLPDGRVRLHASLRSTDPLVPTVTDTLLWTFDPATGQATPLLALNQTLPGLAPDESIVAINRNTHVFEDESLLIRVETTDSIGARGFATLRIATDDTITVMYGGNQTASISGINASSLDLGSLEMYPQPQRYITANDQLLWRGSVREPDGTLYWALMHTDEAGDIHALAVRGDMFDFDPNNPGGEAGISQFEIWDVNTNGQALVEIHPDPDAEGVGSVFVFVDIAAPSCAVDVNDDGLVNPADFNAWVLAFNAQTSACDQNGDGLCNPADFNAWVINFNTGCP
ncbi:MAG: GC-type dockerin domain-anchored protein [Planctomycetota bacterium]